MRWVLVGILVLSFLWFVSSSAPAGAYTINGVSICGINYNCNPTPDSVCPSNYATGSTCRICDGDCATTCCSTNADCSSTQVCDLTTHYCINSVSTCTGTAPTGTGVVRGNATYTGTNTPSSWTFTNSPSPGTCYWTCGSGYSQNGTTCEVTPSGTCGDGIIQNPDTQGINEQCDGGSCCIPPGQPGQCTYRTSTSTCSSTTACTGPGNPGTTQTTTTTQYCTGSSANCTGSVQVVVQNVTAGNVCYNNATTPVTSTVNCGVSPATACSGQQPIGYALGADGSGACTVNSGIAVPVGLRCPGAENDTCWDGTCQNACWVQLNTSDPNIGQDNNHNGLNDSNETGVCIAQCSLAGCQATAPSSVLFQCGVTGGSSRFDWTTNGDFCAGAGEACYCGACPPNTYYNTSDHACHTLLCPDTTDADRDGLYNWSDPDCNLANQPPQVTLTPNVTTALIGEPVGWHIQITDEQGVNYTFKPGDGTTRGPFQSGQITDYVETATYTSIGTKTGVLWANDSLGQTNQTSAQVTIACSKGSIQGIPATDASSCCATACFYNGRCYGDMSGGTPSPVCINNSDLVCANTGGTYQLHDRDEAQLYANLNTASCNPIPWLSNSQPNWCEGAVTDSTNNSRCNTYNNVSTQFACGDDPVQNAPYEYQKNSSGVPYNYVYYKNYTDWNTKTNGVSYRACLNSATGCFGMDSNGNFHHYSGALDCSKPNDDNNCDGVVDGLDAACSSAFGLNVTVKVKRAADQTFSAASGATITVKGEGPLLGYYSTATADATGNYDFQNVPPGTYKVTGEWQTAITNSTTVTISQAGADVPVRLYERICNSDCTNNLGYCDPACQGLNGCPAPSALTTNQERVFNACAPQGSSTSFKYGQIVYLDQNATARETGLCCTQYLGWEPAPKASLSGNMSNLIKYTRLVTLNGLPVRLVIATWD